MTVDIVQAEKILQDMWDKDVEQWRQWWVPIFRKFAGDLISDAGLRPGQIVLDIGTGTGVAAVEAARKVRPGGIVLAIDRSSRMLEFAETDTPRAARNLCYLVMDGDNMLFPDEMLDGVVSNCGISYASFLKAVTEIFRVLRKGGRFTFNDWHLIDVPAHRKFGGILQEYRTNRPSEELRIQRAALALYEHTGNRYMNLDVLVDELKSASFTNISVKRRSYKIKLNGVQHYLDLRLRRAALKQELSELSKPQRARLLAELRNGLKVFVHGDRFILDWDVTFVQAEKPG